VIQDSGALLVAAVRAPISLPGLQDVKHVANVHGGRAEVETAVGKGSSFRITLPMGALASS
jgi:light-regulated signal transduction histidine kinase (bacteriophytochrome)